MEEKRKRVKHPKEYQQISMSPDVRIMLKKQSDEKGLSISSYIERLILEKEYSNSERK